MKQRETVIRLMRDSLQILCLGVLLFTSPPIFRSLAAAWYPAQFGTGTDATHTDNVRTLRRKFWHSAMLIVAVVMMVLFFQYLRKGGLALTSGDWLRIVAVILALMAALGRGGWAIQSWDGTTVVERIDRGMYMIEQLGAATLLILALTL